MEPNRRSYLYAAALALAACQGSGSPAAAPDQLPPNASVTVFPVLLADRPSADAAQVVGILLERGGLQRVEVAPAAFAPDRAQGFVQQAAAFGAFVAEHGLATDYALLADFRGSPRRVEEVSGAIVDARGTVVWSDQQRPGDPDFDHARPDEPMECAVLLVRRLRAPLRLDDPTRAGAPEGSLARRMQAQAGVPDDAERAAMARRLDELRRAGPPRLRVYPPRVGEGFSAESAQAIAAALTRAGTAQATAAAEPLRFTAEASSNEQRVLWSAAKSIRDAVRALGPQQEHLLLADFLLAPDGKAGAVHTFLLSPAGELVVADYQNSHHADFQRVAPDSLDDCSELVAGRLARCLKR